MEDAVPLRQKYNENKAEIDRLKPELAAWQQKQEEIAPGKGRSQKATTMCRPMTITGYRLSCKTARLLTISPAGQRFLERLHLYPKRHNPEYQRLITFKATLKIDRKPKYFLGIKIHRAILQISWDLTTEYSDTHVVEVITLDPDMSDKEKTKLANDRIAEIAKEYPEVQDND